MVYFLTTPEAKTYHKDFAGDMMTGTLTPLMMTLEVDIQSTMQDQFHQGIAELVVLLQLYPELNSPIGEKPASKLSALFSRGLRQENGPKTYKTYMLELPDDVTPEDAQKKYDEYLTRFWGSARKAYFQSIKDKPE